MITDQSGPSASIDSYTDPSCGQSNGSITISAIGGSAPYSYDWSPNGYTGEGTTMYSNIPQGNYTVTITDINGCTVTTSQSISDTDGPTVSIASYTNPLCPGNADGSINLSVSGGSAPYSYTWSPSGYTGDGTANYSNLPEGSYTVTVSDANSCEGTASQSISDPIALSASIASQADATCVGCCNGAASISGSNGTSPYTYSWPDGSTNQTNNGLCAGTHEVTISDANNCTTTTTVTIGEPEALNASIASFSNPSCNGECDGSATITVNGGSTPYYYEWSNLGSTATVNNLCNGVYTVTVTDFLFTSVTASVTITEPAAIVPTITGDSETCTGSALLSTQNTYITYQWYLDGNPISGANNATYTASASGTYTVETGDGTCTGISVGHALIVHPITEPIISGDNEICSSGGSSNLNLNTTYNTYQWLLNGTNLSGETAASLIANQSGEYTVTVMDGTCQLTSDIFTISSVDPIGITQNPVDATICPGENHTFTVTGTGQIDAYQWLKNNIPIAGATSDTYTISNASTLDDGIYKCELDNICGTETSTAATLSVNQMLITDQPQDYEGCETDTITLSTVATGNNLSYQWQLNGIDIPEEISNELTLEGIFVDDLGQYNCIVSDDCQSQSTDTATVSHDLVNITIQPESQTTCPGINVTYAISATGANLSYQWQKDGTDIPGANNYFYIVYNAQLADTGLYNCIVTNQCFSSSSDTAYLKMENPAILTQPTDEMICSGESITLSVEAQGYTIDYLWKKDGSIVSGGDSNSITINAADISDEGDYICYISTFCTNLVSDTASLELKDININQQPEDLTLCLGNDASFSVSADGYMNSYQWQHNGTDITGENNATLNLENIAQNNQGIYNCSISNECGVIHTNEVQLSLDTLLIFAHPSSVNICEGEDVTFSSGAFSSVSPRNFQWQKNGIDLPGETNYYLTIPNASYSDTAEYTCIVSNLCETDTTNIAILQIDTTYISMQPSNIEVCTNQPFTLSAEGIGPNISYRWLKNNEYIPGANSANYTVNYASEDNAGEYFCEISSNCITMHTDTVSVSISSITIETTSNDIIACQGDTIDFSIAASGNNIAYQWMFNGDSISGETNSSLQLNNISTAKTGIYYCILSNNCDTIISDVMNLNIDTLTITEQPENVQACLGNNAAFSVSASGQDLSYQWLKNGMEINNATNSFYYINNVSQTDTALYSCIVSSLCETDTSQAALLWLDTIGITNQSDIVYACQNDTLSIFVSAVGTNLMYKWKKNGNYIPNATDSIYYINGLYQNNAASYTCEVSNNCGMIESQSIYVNINSLEITNESVNDTACIGDNV
ncbi:MAG: hypothetical protein C0594_15455 [Marinilabiliales bacterium]|nr:MAG: hypothetical protein C0594_15455 [Marinilabiliales bacterium]